ncbi:sulfurtransferase TusA family protein [Snodgrassella sp. ESL0324]|uniref:sulfurtransferase TusA family protein n=1 Tax=Snodgrassella sp. ESL0324 TaxID=2705033 RepID=UPI001582EA67|nr:sulfurtransferase TusA family protein [Snodgrassella sp. ESL0324]NUF08872.1 sulfurtransferase TusA family protein [Snodgrassella sp. ESL0324]
MSEPQSDRTLDVIDLNCPMPILRAKKALAAMDSGEVLLVLATDKTAPDDFAAFCRQTGHELLHQQIRNDGVIMMWVKHR